VDFWSALGAVWLLAGELQESMASIAIRVTGLSQVAGFDPRETAHAKSRAKQMTMLTNISSSTANAPNRHRGVSLHSPSPKGQTQTDCFNAWSTPPNAFARDT